MIAIPYGKTNLSFDQPCKGVLTSKVDQLKSEKSGLQLVEEAMANPIGSPKLAELAVGKKRCTVIISDHTRPVPSRDILPPHAGAAAAGQPGD